MKGLNVTLSIVLASLLVGCGTQDAQKSSQKQTTQTNAVATKVEADTQKSKNAFQKMMQYKDDAQMQKTYPTAYAQSHNFDIDINKITNLQLLKEYAKAKVEVTYIDALKNLPAEVALQKASPRLLRIINGTQAKLDNPTWKFIVSLQYDNQHACGGSLIAKDWVVTAAHCVSAEDGSKSKVLPTIVANTYSLSNDALRVATDAIYIHPLYTTTQGEDGDIALVHLQKSIENAALIGLSTKKPEPETKTQVAGWGNMSTTSLQETDALMEVVLPVIDSEVCKNSYANENMTITDGMICAGYMNGSKDSCQGDSGGPLVVTENGKNVLAGVVSFGGSAQQSCGAPNFPGVYTSVSNYASWIQKQIVTSSGGTIGDEQVESNITCDFNDDFGEYDSGMQSDISMIESELEPLFESIESAQSIEELKGLLDDLIREIMQIFS